MPEIQNFKFHYSTLVEILPRSIYEFWGANLVCCFRGEVV